MAYDRYDRDERSRWSNNDRSDQSWRGDNRGHRDERGFWDRASDEVASWFGDDDAERRRRQDTRHDERTGGGDRWQSRDQGRSGEHSAFGRGWGSDSDSEYDRGYGRNYDRDESSRDQSSYGGSRSDRDFNYDRGVFNRGGSSERDYNRKWRGNLSSDRNRDRDYRPMTGDYGREGHESDQFFAASGYGRNDYGRDRDSDRSQTPYDRDQFRRTSWAGSREDNPDHDPNYRDWRNRHMSDLDRDYDDYRREHQSKFENDFSGWREKRQNKRGLLGQVREHMEVVGKDDKHVGTVDRTAGDRIILTKSDPDSGGVHHSLSCSDIDKVEGDKVMLDCSAEDAKTRWRDESRDRALHEPDDQGEMGPRNLNRSFEGTYR
jgi:hypothetical protein